MSDEQTEQERDAATLATIREFMDVTKEYDNAQDGHSIRDGTRALLRTIDRLTAERDAARAELATLREACAGAPAMMADMLGFLRAETGWMRVSYDKYAKQIAAKADAIRAALGDAD